MQPNDIVVVAGKYRVAAFAKRDGQALWLTELEMGFFSMGTSFVSVTVDETGVYACNSGELFCLALETGKIIWRRKLSVFGRGVISVAMAGGEGPGSAAAAQMEMDRRRRASATSTNAAGPGPV